MPNSLKPHYRSYRFVIQHIKRGLGMLADLNGSEYRRMTKKIRERSGNQALRHDFQRIGRDWYSAIHNVEGERMKAANRQRNLEFSE